MFCLHCGTKLPDDALFCFNCGTKQDHPYRKIAPETEMPYEEPEKVTAPAEEEAAEPLPETDLPAAEELPEAETPAEEPVVPEVPETVREDEPLPEEPLPEEDLPETELPEEPLPIEELPEEDLPEIALEETEEAELSAAISEEQKKPDKFCPFCGAGNDEDAVFCESCGRRMSDVYQAAAAAKPAPPKAAVQRPLRSEAMQKTRAPQEKGGGKGKWIGLGLAAAAVIAVVLFLVLGGGDSRYLAYQKDGSLLQIDLNDPEKGPETLSEGTYGTGVLKYSQDGAYVLYPGDFASMNSDYPLMMKKLGSKDVPVRLDADVSFYEVLADDSVIFQTSDDDLYRSGYGQEKTRIAEDVNGFTLSEDGSLLLYSLKGNEGLYGTDTALQGEKTKLFDAYDYYSVSRDLKTVCVADDNVLYVIENFGSAEKVAENFYSFEVMEDGSVWYALPEAEGTAPWEKFFENDLTEEQLAEPEYPNENDYRITITEKDGTGRYVQREALDEEAYEAAVEAYEQKLDAQEAIEEITGEAGDLGATQTVYRYQGGESTVVREGVFFPMLSRTDGALYYAIDETAPKIPLSEIYEAAQQNGEVDEESYYIRMAERLDSVFNDLSGETVLEGYVGQIQSWDKTNRIVYATCYDYEKQETQLCAFALAEGGKKSPVAAGDSSWFITLADGRVAWIDSYGEGGGALHLNGEKIAEGVYSTYPDETNGLYYLADVRNDAGTLYYTDGGAPVKIAEDVYLYHPVAAAAAAVITDYSSSRESGDLKFCTGSEAPVRLDEDVDYIIAVQPQKD